MIKLNSARKLQAILAGAVATTQPAATLGYSDKTAVAFDGDAELHDLNGATAVDICPAPSAGAIRQVDYLTIRNYDSAQVVVTVRVNEGGTLHNIFQATLQAGEVLGFTHAAGWYVTLADGSRKSGAQDLSAYVTYVAVAAGYQPLDGDLSAIALLLTTPYGRGLLELADAAGLRAVAGLGTLATQSATITDYGLLAAPLSQFAATTSAQLAGVVSDETGTGALVFAGSPAFTGAPSAPTAVDLTNTTQLATTQYVVTRVAQAVADLVASSPATLDTLNELATALGDDPAFAATMATALGNRLRVDTAAQGLSGAQQGNALTNLGLLANAQSLVGAANYAAMKVLLSLDNVENKSSATIRGELTSGNVTTALAFTPENPANKDVSAGYVGKTLEKINFWNAARTFMSFFTNAATAPRTYTFPDKDITVAGLVDITGANSGTNTGDQTITLTSDVTGSGTGSFATTIANAAVTYAKMQNVSATSRILGRITGGAGSTEELTAANVKTILGLVSNDVGLGNVTNDAQTKAAIVPNTAPSAGQLLVGNAGGTAYAPVAASGDATVSSAGAFTLATANGNVGSFTNASITVNAKGQVTAASSGAAGAVLTANTFTGAQEIDLAVAATSTDGEVLATTAVATVGAQKWSPRFRWTGSGWKTATTAGAQTVDFIAEVQPVQGAANPSVNWVLSAQINGGGYTAAMTVNNFGTVSIPGNFSASGSVTSSSGTSNFAAASASNYSMGNAGTFTISNGTNFSRGFALLDDNTLEINNGTRTASSGAFRDLKLRSLISSGGVVTLSTFTVSTLPSASTSGAGSVAYVTDATSTTYHTTVAGTGANKVQVMSDGTNWLIS